MTERRDIAGQRWPQTMRLDTASAYLDMSRMTFLRLVDDGTLPEGKLLNGLRLWSKVHLDAWQDRFFNGRAGGTFDERKRRWQEDQARQENARGRNDQDLQV